MVLRICAGALLLAGLAGCVQTPAADCPADWRAAGAADGAAGLADDRYETRAAACTAAGAPAGPDARPAFLDGLAEGRAAFCSPRAALERGRRARPFGTVCGGAHRDLYRAGLDEHWLRVEIRDAHEAPYDDALHPFGFAMAMARVRMLEDRLAYLHDQNEARLRAVLDAAPAAE
ncbi:DUF2799 domain-containing protein [Rhodovulum sp. DZ06]|uniref:DUF2799 domain-containing protein n=1 Tax=Rhodovulum sp. DZ06 TaxID=3425126 RepID=UPI003D33CC35